MRIEERYRPMLELLAHHAFGGQTPSIAVEAHSPLEIVDAKGDQVMRGFMAGASFSSSLTMRGQGRGDPAGGPLAPVQENWSRSRYQATAAEK